MAEINENAFCGGIFRERQNGAYSGSIDDLDLICVCPFYHHMEDADAIEPGHVISLAWGHCQRFPKWERKSPSTKACGEHPQYFMNAVAPGDLNTDDLFRVWVNKATGERITTMTQLDEAMADGTAHACRPGEVIPIDGPIS